MNYFLSCLTTNYVGFSGRARRAEYWYYYLFLFILSVLAVVADFALGTAILDPSGIPTGLGTLSIVLGLATLLPTLAATVRRLHDTDRSAWWLLLYLLPLIGPLVVFIFLVLKGTTGENRFGPDPIAGGAYDEVFK